jgi:hypothetical protein
MARVFGHPTRTLVAVLGLLLGSVCVKAQDISLLYIQSVLVVDLTKGVPARAPPGCRHTAMASSVCRI